MNPENCERHEREINRLRDKADAAARELAEKDKQLVALQHDHEALADRLPENLGQWMGEMSTKLSGLVRGQDDVVKALREGYVTVAELEAVKLAQKGFATRSELDTLRTEMRPITSAFWQGARTVALALLGALLALLLGKLPHS